MIKILYFARLREQLGTAGEELPAAAGLATVGDLAALLRGRGGIWSNLLAEGETIQRSIRRWPVPKPRSRTATKWPSSRRLPGGRLFVPR